MNCYKQGETRLMLTTVPFFKELVVSSFECENCGYKTVDHENIGTQRPEFVKCPLCQCKARTQTIDKAW